MADELDLATIYERAADWLEAHEWIQGAFAVNATGERTAYASAICNPTACCAEGAIIVACRTANLSDYDDYRARSSLCPEGHSLNTWNDASGRTKAEVIAKLRQAATASRAGGG